MQFIEFDIFVSTNFAENLSAMNSSLLSNRILPYFEKVLMDSLSLQKFGDFNGCSEKKVVCPLIQKNAYEILKNIKILFCHFFIN